MPWPSYKQGNAAVAVVVSAAVSASAAAAETLGRPMAY